MVAPKDKAESVADLPLHVSSATKALKGFGDMTSLGDIKSAIFPETLAALLGSSERNTFYIYPKQNACKSRSTIISY
jgi:hypothetical protein